MDPAWERQIRDVLDQERFGVLATSARGRLHTATIHFAATADLELVHAIRPVTLKAEQALAEPRVAFQIDNREILLTSRKQFTRISLEGALFHVSRDDPEYQRWRDVFARKLPVGDRLLDHADIEMYVLRPSRVRIAIGADAATDVDLEVGDRGGEDGSAEREPGV